MTLSKAVVYLLTNKNNPCRRNEKVDPSYIEVAKRRHHGISNTRPGNRLP
jgi:hypothetical protein